MKKPALKPLRSLWFRYVLVALALACSGDGPTAPGTPTPPPPPAPVPVAAVQLDAAGLSLLVGQTRPVTAVPVDAGGNSLSGRSATWSSDNSLVAAVSATGVVTALAPGSTAVTATIEGKAATLPVTVALVPVKQVSVQLSAAAAYVGMSVAATATALDSAGSPLSGRTVTWSTGNSAVATVTSAGVVTAVAPGTVDVFAEVEGVKSAASLSVALVPVATVAVTPASRALYVGQQVDLTAGAKDSAGNSLTGRAVAWSSSNSVLATVSSTGVVTAVAPGAVTITATVEGKTGMASISVALVPVASVSVTPATKDLYIGQSVDLTAGAKDSAGNSLTGRAVAWSSSNATVATVSTGGVVAAVTPGNVSITATVEGKTAQATIAVRHDPIVFVHGFGASSSVWSTMTGWFTADGWRAADLVSWSYNSLQSNVATAALLKTTIDSLLAATGAKRVDIIAHSMGGLPSRYYMKNLDGAAKVDAWVSLSGPNHGTDTATQCSGLFVSCAEMVIGSAFLSALNGGDETPGASRYATWWSPCDTTINPDDSVPLAGATNTQTACLGHSVLYSDLSVYGEVKGWIR